MLAAFGVVITVVFAATRLDLSAAAYFYRDGHWPLGRELPWSLFYRMSPWIVASLVLGSLAALAVGIARQREALRRHAIFVLLSVVLGPGLVVNFVLKDHWERPRPREIVEFGGDLPYRVAPLRGEGGKSFPCGHCSVGFLYALGWWIWRTRRPSWAWTSLGVGLAAGTALGLGRMAGGGHFLSDVVWSAYLALGLAHLLYCYALPRMHRLLPLLAGLGGVAVLAALFVTAHGTHIATDIPLAGAPKVFEVIARTANVEIIVDDSPSDKVSVNGELHGFGLPGSRLSARSEFVAEPATLRYVVEQEGWFTDLDAQLSIHIPAARWERIVVRLDHGNIKVTDLTAARLVASEKLPLDLRTKKGLVRVEARTGS